MISDFTLLSSTCLAPMPPTHPIREHLILCKSLEGLEPIGGRPEAAAVVEVAVPRVTQGLYELRVMLELYPFVHQKMHEGPHN